VSAAHRLPDGLLPDDRLPDCAATLPGIGAADVAAPDVVTPDVVVLGPARSSQSLIAAALAQHTGARLVRDLTWCLDLGRGVVAARSGAVGAAGRGSLAPPLPPEPAATDPGATDAVGPGWFARAAGRAAGELIARHDIVTTAPLDAGAAVGDREVVSWMTVTGPVDVALAAAMFPDAVLLGTLRHPDAVVESLASKACGDGAFASRPAGYRAWVEGVDAMVLAARAWPERAGVVDVASVHADPGSTLSRVLTRISLDWDPLCAAVLDSVTADRDLAAVADPAGTGHQEERDVALARYEDLRDCHRAPFARREPHHPSRAVLDDALGSLPRPGPGPGASRYATLVALAVPSGGVAAVISKGDPALVDVDDRTLLHLPAGPDGTYAGHHPATGPDAVAALEAARVCGARFLVVPAASQWWLDHYGDLATHLETAARLIAGHVDIATVFELTTTDSHVAPAPAAEPDRSGSEDDLAD
jgi:hypothetical protein